MTTGKTSQLDHSSARLFFARRETFDVASDDLLDVSGDCSGVGTGKLLDRGLGFSVNVGDQFDIAFEH